MSPLEPVLPLQGFWNVFTLLAEVVAFLDEAAHPRHGVPWSFTGFGVHSGNIAFSSGEHAHITIVDIDSAVKRGLPFNMKDHQATLSKYSFKLFTLLLLTVMPFPLTEMPHHSSRESIAMVQQVTNLPEEVFTFLRDCLDITLSADRRLLPEEVVDWLALLLPFMHWVRFALPSYSAFQMLQTLNISSMEERLRTRALQRVNKNIRTAYWKEWLQVGFHIFATFAEDVKSSPMLWPPKWINSFVLACPSAAANTNVGIPLLGNRRLD